MPWNIEKRGEKYCVIKDSDGGVEKCHDTEKEAQAHLIALNIAEAERAQEDAPNYRQSESNTERCSTCRFASDGFCELFDFDFTPDFVCDAWESIPVELEESEPGRGIMETLARLWESFTQGVERLLENMTGESLAVMRRIKQVDSWDGSASRWDSTDAYCSDTLIDVNAAAGRDEKAQSYCKLPIREPGDSKDTFVWQAATAAAAVLGGGRGGLKKPDDVPEEAWNSAVKSAANKIIDIYNENDETAPDSVYETAGKEPPERAVSVGQVYDSIWDALMERDFAFVHDIFVDSGNRVFAVVSERGKLFKLPLEIVDDQVSFGTEEEVVMDFRPTGRTSVVRQQDGRYRWISVSATSVLNRVGEIDSRELFDSFVECAERTGEYPYRTFYHQGEILRTGEADYLARDGNVYITSGLYDEGNDLALAEVEALEREPEYWGESIRYMPTSPPELVEIGGVSIPVYREGFQIETSILPEHKAAAWFTAISNQEVMRMKEEVRDELLKLFGGDEARLNAFVSQVDETNREIEEQNLIARSTDETEDSEEVVEEEVEETTEEEESEEELEIELGDEFIQQVADQVAHSLSGEVEALRAAITEFSEKVEGLDKKVSAQFIKAEERLRELEKSDEEKQAEWLQDLPKKQKQRILVTHRARMPEGEEVPESLADVAEATLSKMPAR